MEQGGGSGRIELPEDGYEWRKYGQKFIRQIEKFRAYYKCQRANCPAKKRVEWSESEPRDLRIAYEGGQHNHGSSSQQSDQSSTSRGTSTSANQYNLITQVFGDNPPPP